MAKERILVVGAGGQLGSELTQRLQQIFGLQAVVASDVREPAIKGAQGVFEVLDVMDVVALESLLSKNKFTQIYHLAAVLSATGERKPELAWQINMQGLLNVLEGAVKHKVEKVYWPSSIAVFGPSTPRDKTPQDTIMDPTTVYGISKLAGERWCAWYHKKFGLDVRSLRYPGLIGYKAHPGGGTTDYAVDIFFKAITDKAYECFLSSKTFLPMMYMEDAIDATIQLMEAPDKMISVRSSYNIGAMSFCPEDVAVEIRRHIADFRINYNPDFRQQIADSWPRSIDDSVARRDWGWNPKYDLPRMVSDMLEKLPVHHNLVESQ